jgi:hypothetical protein
LPVVTTKHTQNRTAILNNWSSDGRYLLFGVFDPGKGFGLDAVPMFGDRKPFAYLAADSNNGEHVKLSRDGNFLAYTSGESKHAEVFVETFPEHIGKWQVSTGGGDWPVWSPDGRELYFLSNDGKMMAVAVKISGRNFEAGVPRPLFSVPGRNQVDSLAQNVNGHCPNGRIVYWSCGADELDCTGDSGRVDEPRTVSVTTVRWSPLVGKQRLAIPQILLAGPGLPPVNRRWLCDFVATGTEGIFLTIRR